MTKEPVSTLDHLSRPKAGKFIRSLRMRYGLGQQQIADALGHTRETVRSFESGRRVPSDRVMRLLPFIENILRTGAFNEWWLGLRLGTPPLVKRVVKRSTKSPVGGGVRPGDTSLLAAVTG